MGEDGLTTCRAGIRYSLSICVIFHQLPYWAGVNLFSVTDIFRAWAIPQAELKGTFGEMVTVADVMRLPFNVEIQAQISF